MKEKEYLYFEVTFFDHGSHMVDMYRGPAGMNLKNRGQYWIDCVEQHSPIALIFSPGGVCIFVRREGAIVAGAKSKVVGLRSISMQGSFLICAGPAGQHYHLLGLEDVPHVITGLEQPE